MKSLIIGADVGGTNTDVVCMHDKTVIAFEKVPTTDDVTTGLQMAISNTLSKLPKGGQLVYFKAIHLKKTEYLLIVIKFSKTI